MNKHLVSFFLYVVSLSSSILFCVPPQDLFIKRDTAAIASLQDGDQEKTLRSLLSEYTAAIPQAHYSLLSAREDLAIATTVLSNKMALFVFKTPEPEEHYYLTEHEKIIARTIFPRCAYEEKNGYTFASSFYVDERLFPTNRQEAIALLCCPYISAEPNAPPAPLNDLQREVVSCRNDVIFSDKEGVSGDTLIETKHGYCTIRMLKTGDKIAACNLRNGKKTFSTVTRIEKEVINNYVQITLAEETLRVAQGHQFNISDKKERVLLWITAQRLAFLPEYWKLVHPLVTDIQEVNESLEVYRLTIDENENFYISKHAILVHNFVPVLAVSIYFGSGITVEVLAPTLAALTGYLAYKTFNVLRDFVVGSTQAHQLKMHPYLGYDHIQKSCNIYPFITSHQEQAAEVPKTKAPSKTDETPKKEKKKKKPTKTFDDIKKDTKPGRKTTGSTTQYEKEGTYQDALEDFNSLGLENITPAKNNNTTLLGDLGKQKVNVRPNSESGFPTLEKYNPKNKTSEKIRYIGN